MAQYPEARQRRLMTLIVNQIVIIIKIKLLPLDVLTNSFEKVGLHNSSEARIIIDFRKKFKRKRKKEKRNYSARQSCIITLASLKFASLKRFPQAF